MQWFVDYLKDGWRLSSPAFLLTILGIGLVLLYRQRTARWGRRWLTAAAMAYWLLATPTGARLVSAPLVSGQHRLGSRDQAEGAQAVVVLGGGILSYVSDNLALDDLLLSGFRVMEGVRVYRLLGDPLLIVSGGNTQRLDPPRTEAAAFRAAAIGLGVPASRIVVEDEPRTTREQAVITKELLGRRHIDRFVLVTSAIHMGRSLAAFRAVGLDPIPSAAPLRSEVDKSPWSVVPAREWVSISDSALYEYVAWAYYWCRGWVTRQPM